MMTYPIALYPTVLPKTKSFTVTKGNKSKKTGASELVAFSHICSLGLKQIKGDVCVKLEGHQYEPDFAYIDEKNGIYIDIELDEPYSGNHRPTHYITKSDIHKDSSRNEIFRRNGWHVVRFTERQMFCQTDSCMRIVFDIVCETNSNATLPLSLKNVSTLDIEDCWNAEESINRSYNNYRKEYLGYNPINMDFASNFKCFLLIVPIIFKSIWNKRLRRMMIKQLLKYFG